jgi:hypothetical protein
MFFSGFGGRSRPSKQESKNHLPTGMSKGSQLDQADWQSVAGWQPAHMKPAIFHGLSRAEGPLRQLVIIFD